MEPKKRCKTTINHCGILGLFETAPENQTDTTEKALGYLALKMPELAADELPISDIDSLNNGDEAALALLSLEQAGASSQRLVDEVIPILNKFPDDLKILELAILYFTSNEDYSEGVQLTETYQTQGFSYNRGTTLQNLACCAAHVGRYSDALELVCEAIQVNINVDQILTDRQLLPLWQHYIKVSDLSDDDCERLASDYLIKYALKVTERSQVPTSVCDFTRQNVLPDKFKPYLKRNISSSFDIEPSAPLPLIREFREWCAASARESIDQVKQVVELAEAKILHGKQT